MQGIGLVVGFAGGEIPAPSLNCTTLRSTSVVGVAYGMSAIRDPEMDRENFAWIFDAYERGALRPRIDSRFPLERAPEALRRVGERAVLGRVIVEVARR